jgi:Tol biopolymer transport system component
MRMRLLATAVLSATVPLLAGCFPGVHPATYVTDRSATLNGRVASLKQYPAGSYWFEYGATMGYDATTPSRPVTFPIHMRVSQPVPGLTAATTYHYRLCVQDRAEAEGPSCSAHGTFTTGPPGGRSGIAFYSERDGQGVTGGDIYVMDANGANPTRLTHDPGSSDPTWSPDARKILFTAFRDPGSSEIFVMNADGGNPTRLTNNAANDTGATWSPDGGKIAFDSTRDGNRDIYLMDRDGGNVIRLTEHPAQDAEPAWSPDGNEIAFTSFAAGNPSIYVMNADGTHRRRLTDGFDFWPAWSPDRTKIAITTLRFGGIEVGTVDSEGNNPIQLTDTGQSFGAAWSPDGAKVTYGSYLAEVFSINADGTNPVNLTNNEAQDNSGVWSPRP